MKRYLVLIALGLMLTGCKHDASETPGTNSFLRVGGDVATPGVSAPK